MEFERPNERSRRALLGYWASGDSVAIFATARSLKYDWQAYSGTGHINGGASGWLRPDGTVVLQLDRWMDCGLVIRMVADADGPVHSAIAELPSTTDCSLGSATSLNEGKIVYTAADDGPPRRWGAVGGNIDDLAPRMYATPASRSLRRTFVHALTRCSH